MLVVPIPDNIPAAGINGFSADVARHSKLRCVVVANTMLLKQMYQVRFAQLGPIHADGIMANIQESPDAVFVKQFENFFRLSTAVPKREKVRLITGARLVPFRFIGDLLFYWDAWQLETMGLRHALV